MISCKTGLWVGVRDRSEAGRASHLHDHGAMLGQVFGQHRVEVLPEQRGGGSKGARGAGTLRLALNANPSIREEITLLINRIAEKLGDLVEPLHTHCLEVC